MSHRGHLKLQPDVEEPSLLEISRPLLGQLPAAEGSCKALQAQTGLDQLRIGDRVAGGIADEMRQAADTCRPALRPVLAQCCSDPLHRLGADVMPSV